MKLTKSMNDATIMKKAVNYITWILSAFALAILLLALFEALPDWYIWLAGTLAFLSAAIQLMQKRKIVLFAVDCGVVILSLLTFLKYL